MNTPPPETPGPRVLYISPLRALAVDVEKNLRAPLQGISLAGERSGHPVRMPTVGMRTGDTPADERRKLVRHPPDLLITTPESLYLMLTSAARETLAGVETVIIDEIHALAATKRGSHLALTLERLEERCERPPQRIGLSATQRPLDEIARFLGGQRDGAARPVMVVDAGVRKTMEIEVVVPVEDMGRLGEIIDEPIEGPAAAGPVRRSIWPSMHPRLLELILEHNSTIVFVNARRLAERLATRLNELHLEGESRAAGGRGQAPTAGPRAGQGPPRLAQPGASPGHRGRAQAGRPEGPGRHQQPGARHRHGRGRPRHPGRVAGLGGQRPAAHRPGRPPGGPAQPGPHLPQAPSRPAGDRGRRRAHARRGHRVHPLPAQPPRRPRPADRGDGRPGRLGRRRPGRRDPPQRPLRRPVRRGPGQRPGPAGRPLPLRGVQRAPPPHRVGPGQRRRPRPLRRPAPGRHQRRDHPRPGPLRRLPARRHAGGRAGRGDGLREPSGRDLPARRLAPGASRRSPPNGSSSPRPRASPGGCRSGTATARVARSSWAGPSARSPGRSGRRRPTPPPPA